MKPMLAGKVTDLHDLRYPLLASPKLDGVRALIIDGVVMSRTMKPIPNEHVQFLFGRSAYEGFDGELIVGDPCNSTAYRDTTSGVMSVRGKPDVTFHVFDDYSGPTAFHERLYRAQVRVRKYAKTSGLKFVEHTELKNPAAVDDYEKKLLALGYEGVMLRSLHGIYKQGRSTEREGYLLKLKRFEDAEATVIGVEELQHNENDRDEDGKRTSHKAGKRNGGALGALHVRSIKHATEFHIGSGFSAEERVKLWKARGSLLGKIVKFQYFPTGSKDKPRFPTFLGFRSPVDL